MIYIDKKIKKMMQQNLFTSYFVSNLSIVGKMVLRLTADGNGIHCLSQRYPNFVCILNRKSLFVILCNMTLISEIISKARERYIFNKTY